MEEASANDPLPSRSKLLPPSRIRPPSVEYDRGTPQGRSRRSGQSRIPGVSQGRCTPPPFQSRIPVASWRSAASHEFEEGVGEKEDEDLIPSDDSKLVDAEVT